MRGAARTFAVRDIARDDLDEKTVAYILETRRPFEDLRQVIAQLSGLLVLASLNPARSHDHPTLDAARRTFAEISEGLRGVRVPPAARLHHEHLLRAQASIGQGLAMVPSTDSVDVTVDSILAVLRVGYAHLQRAAALLPGFRLIAFEHACCSVSLPPTNPEARGLGPETFL